MKLADYLKIEDLQPSAFAVRLGTPASTVTRLLKGERSPGLDLLAKIRTATDGKVTPDDFMPDQVIAEPRSEAAA
jgi:transcriptional regulator with XRE-family HTH domain